MMHRNVISILLLFPCCPISQADVVTFGTGENEFEIVFAEIGDPGNPLDEVIFPHDEVHFGGLDFRPVGGLDYHYSIAMHEVSRDFYRTMSGSSHDRLACSQTASMPPSTRAQGSDCRNG